MRNIITIVISALLTLALTALAFAEPKVEFVTTTDTEGNTLVRCVTPGGTGLIRESAPQLNPNTDQEVIWTIEHSTAVARDIDITGDGVNLITGWWLNVERTSKYAVEGTGVPIWEYSITPNWFVPVSASDDGNVLASTGDVIPLNVWLNGAGPTPSWQFTYPAGYKGYDCNVSDNGAYVTAVCKHESMDNGKLFVFDSGNSTPLWEADYDAENGVNGVEIDEAGNWILVTTYHAFYVYHNPTQQLFYTGTNYSQTKGHMSGDGQYLATGDFNGQLHVYVQGAATYSEIWSHYMDGWVTAVDISSDASVVMAGNFTYTGGYSGEVKAFDIGGTVLWAYDQYGDYISDVELCDDGSVGVASSWGALDYTFGDVFTAFDIPTGDVILRLLDDIDEPGTIWDVAISDDGAYAVCGGKEVHARTSGNGGEVYSIELSLPGPFNVSIDMIPDTLPIVIPAIGGDFNYTVEIVNNEIFAVTFDAWTEALLPNGAVFGPIIDRTVTLGGGISIIRPMTQSVPGGAPPGDYEYRGKVGDSPNTVWDEDSIPFTKLGMDGSGYAGGWVSTGWEDEPVKGTSPSGFILSQNYPNPFNPTTAISYQLQAASYVELAVYDITGREVVSLVDGFKPAGEYEVVFDGSGLSSGIYLYRLETETELAVRKCLLLK